MLFFFSSRRRHTRSYGDWSSDVCSSDLGLVFATGFDGLIYSVGWLVGWPIILFLIAERLRNQIGRASCREKEAASGGIRGDVLDTDNNTVGMGDVGINSAIRDSNVPNRD